MDKTEVLTEQDSRGVLQISLNRPQLRNAISVEVAAALADIFKSAVYNPQVKLVVLRGVGDCFSAGGDLKKFHADLPRAPDNFDQVSQSLNEVIVCIKNMPQLVIAAIKGAAYAAAFGVVLACDLAVSDNTAMLSPSFSNIALAPNASSSYFLPRIIGNKKALEAFVMAEAFNADQAKALGIINQVWPSAEFEAKLNQYIDQLLQRPDTAIKRIKALMQHASHSDLIQHLDAERIAISSSATEKNFAEGVGAFVDKRKPVFNR